MDRLAQPSAAIQITQHGFGQKLDPFRIVGPFQLLLATRQMLQRVFEPEQVCFTLAHCTFLRYNLAGTVGVFATIVPDRCDFEWIDSKSCAEWTL